MNVARSYPKELHRRKSRNKHEDEPPDGSCPEAKAARGALRRSIVFVEEGCGGVRKDISLQKKKKKSSFSSTEEVGNSLECPGDCKHELGFTV